MGSLCRTEDFIRTMRPLIESLPFKYIDGCQSLMDEFQSILNNTPEKCWLYKQILEKAKEAGC